MNLSEQYKKRLQELAGVDVANFDNFSEEEYKSQLKRLGIEKFEDLVGRTVYYSKPVYGEHKVLKWFPDKGEYLLFTGGQRGDNCIKNIFQKELILFFSDYL